MAFLATRFEMQARGTGVSPRGLLVTGSQPPPELAHGISAPDKEFFSKRVDCGITHTSLDRRRSAAGQSADAMSSHRHRGGIISGQQPGHALEIPEGSSLPERREVIMSMSEYEERFRSSTPSLHQIFAAAREANRQRRDSRRLWVAAALVGVLMMTCKIASHHTVHSGTDNGSQVWKSGIQ
jgi:hypothetical protein